MVWSEHNSQAFIDYGRYFVPDREAQIQIMCDLIPPCADAAHILELCCGEGLLARALLEHFPTCFVHGYDGSPGMLQQAEANLASYQDRFTTQQFDLTAADWRQPPWPLQAVVSSLALHHLDGGQKQVLFQDVCRMLQSGGIFLIADLVQPTNKQGIEVAAKAWQETVRQRSLKLDGNSNAFDHFEQQEWNMYLYPDPVDKPSGLFEQLKWLEEAGFREIDVYWMKAGHAIFGGWKLL
jgi:tRNA (cmo5U34)-methyltransferase